MEIEKITSSELRKINKTKVFQEIYSRKSVSKQQLALSLELSLPTISQNLKELQEMQLIERNGLFESTGGRKAQVITCIHDARVAIGLEILKEMVFICAVDLYGQQMKSDFIELTFINNARYYQCLAKWVNNFITSLHYPDERILGVGIAIQGLVSADGLRMIYGKILNNEGVTLEDFSRDVAYPCSLIHDSEAAAFAEIWRQPYVTDALYLSLNHNMGGAVIINGNIYTGKDFRSGTYEHMCLFPNGEECYCGKKGCAEAYCSADSLYKQAGEELSLFFRKLREGDPDRVAIWKVYLNNLALVISSIRHVLDCDMIISGYLQQFLEPADFSLLEQLVRTKSAFPPGTSLIKPGIRSNHPAAIGAALYWIDPFLRKV